MRVIADSGQLNAKNAATSMQGMGLRQVPMMF